MQVNLSSCTQFDVGQLIYMVREEQTPIDLYIPNLKRMQCNLDKANLTSAQKATLFKLLTCWRWIAWIFLIELPKNYFKKKTDEDNRISLPISRASFSDFKPWLLFSMLFSRSWLTKATVNTLISYKIKKQIDIYVDSVHFSKSTRSLKL